MQTKIYKKTLTKFIAVLFIAITGLSWLLLDSGPRVRFIAFERNPNTYSQTVNSVMNIYFDRPLDEQSFDDSDIIFTPNIPFTTSVSNQVVTVRFDENLAHNTEYSLRVGPRLTDLSGNAMSGVHKESFKTTQPRLAYVERNHGFTGEGEQKKDTLYITGIEQEPTAVFEQANIKSFAISNEYALVVASGESSDQLFVVTLKGGDTREITNLPGSRFNQPVLSPYGKIGIFTVSPGLDSLSDKFIQENGNRVYSVQLETLQTTSILNEDETPVQADSLYFDNLGLTALVQDQESNFYAISPYNDYNPAFIGAYIDSFGYSGDSSEILFLTNTTIERYDIATGETTPVIPPRGFIDSVQEANGNLFVFSLDFLAGGQSSKISKVSKTEQTVVWEGLAADENTLNTSSVSRDGSLLALELEPKNCLLDNRSSGARCLEQTIRIISTNSGETIRELTGFDAVWLP